MKKTAGTTMKVLIGSLAEKVAEIDQGTLPISDLEEMVKSAQGIYERMLIIRYKAYEKYHYDSDPPQGATPPLPSSPPSPPSEEKRVVLDFSSFSQQPTVELPTDFSKRPTTANAEGVAPHSQSLNTFTPFPQDPSAEARPEEKAPPPPDPQKEGAQKEKDGPSLNEKLKEEATPSLQSKLQSTPIEDLKAAISIAKKFEFIRFLFDGDEQRYEGVLTALNGCASEAEAIDKLRKYASQFNWDIGSGPVLEFVEFVERRYL